MSVYLLVTDVEGFVIAVEKAEQLAAHHLNPQYCVVPEAVFNNVEKGISKGTTYRSVNGDVLVVGQDFLTIRKIALHQLEVTYDKFINATLYYNEILQLSEMDVALLGLILSSSSKRDLTICTGTSCKIIPNAELEQFAINLITIKEAITAKYFACKRSLFDAQLIGDFRSEMSRILTDFSKTLNITLNVDLKIERALYE